MEKINLGGKKINLSGKNSFLGAALGSILHQAEEFMEAGDCRTVWAGGDVEDHRIQLLGLLIGAAELLGKLMQPQSLFWNRRLSWAEIRKV